jgi:hypothetical protein
VPGAITPEGTMRRNIGPIFWMLLLGAIPAALYGWYFFDQRQRIADLDQRELGRAAENLRGILQTAVVNVSNLTKRPEFVCKFLERQPYLILPPRRNCEDVRDREREKPLPAMVQARGDGLTIAAEDGPLEFRVDLEKILDELVAGNGFEYLFVADEKGNVLFQTRRGERKRWLDKLRWTDRHARDTSVKPTMPLRLRNIADLTADAEGKAALQNLAKTTNAVRVRIAGDDYRLYLQPLGSLAEIAPKSESSRAIVLGGLVNSRASIAEALAVEPRLALGLAVLAGLGLLTWPLVKLFVLAPSERFKFVDFYLLLLSASALLGISVIILLDLDNYRRLDSRAANRLELEGEKLARDLASELSAAVQQLSFYDAALKTSAPNGVMNCRDLAEGTRLFAPPSNEPSKLGPPAVYRHFISAFWARGDDGMQFAKFTTMGENTPSVSVLERPYFHEAREGHVWTLADRARQEYSGRGFFVQVYRSITTGDFETGLSMPSEVRCEEGSSTRTAYPNVAVLTTVLASLSPKALPPDLGFMMIDRSGRVLYHYDPRRALREDLFEEVSEPERLRALVMAERASRLKTKYRSIPHELYIRPLREVVLHGTDVAGENPAPAPVNGWFLVTFRDLQLLRTANCEAISSALIWGTFYFLGLQFVPALILVVRGPKHSRWIWPSDSISPLSKRLTFKLILLAAIAVVSIKIAQGWMLPVVASLIGACAMAIGTWDYVRWRNLKGPKNDEASTLLGRLPAGHWRLSTVSLLFILISILPAAGFFKFAWSHEVGALLHFEAEHVAQTEADLKLQTRDHAREQFARVYGAGWEKIAGGAIEERERALAGDSRGIPSSAARSADILADWKPVYNDASAALRYHDSSPDLLVRDGLSMRPGVLATIGGLLLGAALVWWIRYWLKNLLLAGLVDAPPAPADAIARIQSARVQNLNLIIVTSSQAQEEAIRGLLAQKAARAAVVGSESGKTRTVSADNSALDLTDFLRTPKTRLRGLLRMEKIAAAGGGIVFSRVDPVPALLEDVSVAAPGDGDASHAGATLMEEWERRRWSDLLEKFVIVVVPLSVDTALRDECDTAKTAGSPPRNPAYFSSLWNSCTSEEKLVLVHVAEEGFANPRKTQTVERLMRRGLLVMEPDLRTFDPDFQRFIRHAYERKTLAEWERPVRGIGWTQTRWILGVLVVTVAVFLVSTQRQTLTPVVSFVSALTGAIAGVLKLVSEFSPKQNVVR